MVTMPWFVSAGMPAGGRSPGRHPLTRVGAVVGVAALCATLAGLTAQGAAAVAWVHDFFEYYSGVFSLVALSVTVMGGIAATERGLLRAHQRVQLQIVHRAMAFTSVAFLAAHIALKVMEAHARVLDAVIPFEASHRALPIGLGTIASYLMVTVLWTGVIRARFAANARPWLWRALHSSAYVAWPLALAHGLEAGRTAKPWVMASYGACLTLVSAALIVRLFGWLVRRSSAPRARRARTTRGAVMSTPVPPTAVPTSAVPTTAVPTSDGNSARSAVPQPIHARPPESPAPARSTAKPRPTRGRVQPAHARPPAPPRPAPEAPSADASDEEFWAFMRGEALR
jgi:hypothetical protein